VQHRTVQEKFCSRERSRCPGRGFVVPLGSFDDCRMALHYLGNTAVYIVQLRFPLPPPSQVVDCGWITFLFPLSSFLLFFLLFTFSLPTASWCTGSKSAKVDRLIEKRNIRCDVRPDAERPTWGRLEVERCMSRKEGQTMPHARFRYGYDTMICPTTDYNFEVLNYLRDAMLQRVRLYRVQREGYLATL